MSIKFALLDDLRRAAARLAEVLKLEKTDVVRDSAIKRFELCFDLAWKCIQIQARTEGIECNSPRSCLKVAFQIKLVDYDETWLKMLDDRNLSVHAYKEKYADEIYGRLPLYAEMLTRLVGILSK